MPSEITAFIQTQTQTLQNTKVQVNQEAGEQNIQPGQFASLINELTMPEETQTEQVILAVNPEDAPQLMTFTGNNSFSQSVIDILAGLNENETQTENLRTEISEIIDDITDVLKDSGEKIQDDVQSIISKVKAVISEKMNALKSEIPDDINEIVSQVLNDESIPEDTKNEIVKALDEFVNSLKDSEDSGSVEYAGYAVLNIPNMIDKGQTEHKVSAAVEDIKPEAPYEEDDDNDDINHDDISVSIVGAAVIPIPNAGSKAESQPELTHTNQNENVQVQNVFHERKSTYLKADIKLQNESEAEAGNLKSESKFDEHPEVSDEVSENENDTSNENMKHDNNPSGHEENSESHDNTSGTQTVSRPRNDTRRTSSASSRTQDDHADTASHRTESHNTFQSFFEGVLSSRRNASRTSPLPLNLSQNQQTASYTLSQSQTLRDGMINVVRFIRADGMQKANVIVDPPALGRISVELTSGTSGVEASIKVASEQIRQLVQDQLLELRMNLSQQGVQVAEFTVDVQQDNSHSNHQNSNDDGNRYMNFAVSEADDDSEEFRIDLEEGLLYWVA